MTVTENRAAVPQPLSSAEARALAQQHGLEEAGVRPRMGTYLKQLWARRDFIRVFSTSKAYAKHQGSYLGQMWAALNPTLNAIIYTVIFGFILGTSRGLDNVVAFIVIGVFVFRLIDNAISTGARAIDGNMQLVRSLRFPRAVLPLATVLTSLTLFVPTVVVMCLFTFGAGFIPLETLNPVPLNWHWLEILPAVALVTVLNTGISLFMARYAYGKPDLLQVLPFVTRLLMYGSGVLFSIEHYVSEPTWLRVALEHQPVAIYLELFRMIMMNEPSIPYDPWIWAWAGGWALLVLVSGLVYFWAAEERYGRD
ncbi:ABC transporter permease [Myceligenerans pegani]|uniref:ABC transporter permease n=1 Tax=Myceligenerans pegani TaxID=2776917 RepID=A0ABR9MZF0_9MICO|nr:ABC transporter permease [Myceligenerans sp. TRM 65318]MBE1876366.1 ABC transporter permease [Myceligenerans sp. TRM 65318]MBE3018637.1 ABC transporter permease [Myceligenerans sp. TRM 65318]